LPSNFKIIAEYFVIPLLVLLISYAISGQFNLRYSAGTDFFIFFLSADLGAIIEYEDLRPRINPLFREDYLAVFALPLTMCILFVIASGLTQRKIEAWREQEHRKGLLEISSRRPFWSKISCVGSTCESGGNHRAHAHSSIRFLRQRVTL
jgi:hypothetical protein